MNAPESVPSSDLDAYVHPDRKVLPTKRVYVMAGDGSEGVACNIEG